MSRKKEKFDNSLRRMQRVPMGWPGSRRDACVTGGDRGWTVKDTPFRPVGCKAFFQGIGATEGRLFRDEFS